MFRVTNPQIQSLLEKYEKTENCLSEDVEILLKWLKDQKHFPEIMDATRIKMMYLLSRCSIEATKQRIDNYYTLRTTFFETFLPVDHPDIQKNIELGYWNLLPKLSPKGSRVTIARIRKVERIDEVDPKFYLSRAIVIQEMRLRRDPIFSEILILDMEGLNWGYILKGSPALVSKAYTIYQEIYHNKIEAIIVINSWSSINYGLKIIKSILSEKIVSRIRIFEGYQGLHEIFPKEMIPKDYGGDEKSIEELHEIMNELLEENRVWLNEVNKLRVEEKLRPEELKNDADSGYYGNFKQLSID